MIISPAKNIAVQWPGPPPEMTRPAFLREAACLAGHLRALSPWQLEGPLSLSPERALRAFEQFAAWREEGCVPAVFGYQGLQYRQLAPQSMAPGQLRYLQQRLCILSALYGLLRAMDGICPYRLEMQARLRFEGQDLYRWWGSRVHDLLFDQDGCVLNLASAEYARLVEPWMRPGERMVQCVFYTEKKGRRQVSATYAKMARGAMVRFLAEQGIERAEDAAAFNRLGYRFAEGLSSGGRLVFVRRGGEGTA